MKKLDILTALLVILGGINWGLIGLFGFDLIEFVFEKTWIDRLLYILIGFSAIYKVVNWETIKARWKAK